MGVIAVKNLRLKTIIGIFPREKTEKQDVVINYTISFNSKKAEESDNVEDTIDYKKLNKEIIAFVEGSNFNLLEKLTKEILRIISSDPKVEYAKVEVDKPGALRFADSVSFALEYTR